MGLIVVNDLEVRHLSDSLLSGNFWHHNRVYLVVGSSDLLLLKVYPLIIEDSASLTTRFASEVKDGWCDSLNVLSSLILLHGVKVR